MLNFLEGTIFRADMLTVILAICFAEAIIMYLVFRFGCKNKDLADKFYKIGIIFAMIISIAAFGYLQWFHECAGGPIICDCMGLFFVAGGGVTLTFFLSIPFMFYMPTNNFLKRIKRKNKTCSENQK